MIRATLGIFLLLLSPGLMAQSAEESIIEAYELRHSSPNQALEHLIQARDAIDRLDDNRLFDVNFEIFHLYAMLDKTTKASEIIEYLEERLSHSVAHTPWIALMKVEIMLIRQELDEIDSSQSSSEVSTRSG